MTTEAIEAATRVAATALTTDGTEDHKCISQYACNVQGPNLLGFFSPQNPARKSIQESINDCHEACKTHSNCTHFTWYDDRGAFPNTCYLYASCPSRNTQCHDCFSGLRDCAPMYKTCPAIENDYGGTWFCFPEISSTSRPVDHGTRCIFQCPQHTTYHMCHDGQWSRPPGEKMCTCPPIGNHRNEEKEGKMLCWPPQDLNQPANPGAYCIHACHGHPKHELHCHHGQWTSNPHGMTCHETAPIPQRLNSSRSIQSGEQILKHTVEQMMRNEGHDPATFGRGTSHHSFQYFKKPMETSPPTYAPKYNLIHYHPVHRDVIKDYQVTQLPPQSVSHLPRANHDVHQQYHYPSLPKDNSSPSFSKSLRYGVPNYGYTHYLTPKPVDGGDLPPVKKRYEYKLLEEPVPNLPTPQRLTFQTTSPPSTSTTSDHMDELEEDLHTLMELYESIVSTEAAFEVFHNDSEPSHPERLVSNAPIVSTLPSRPNVVELTTSVPVGIAAGRTQESTPTQQPATHNTTSRIPAMPAHFSSLPPRAQISQLLDLTSVSTTTSSSTSTSSTTKAPPVPVHFPSLPLRAQVSQLSDLTTSSTTTNSPIPITTEIPVEPAHFPSLSPRAQVSQLQLSTTASTTTSTPTSTTSATSIVPAHFSSLPLRAQVSQLHVPLSETTSTSTTTTATATTSSKTSTLTVTTATATSQAELLSSTKTTNRLSNFEALPPRPQVSALDFQSTTERLSKFLSQLNQQEEEQTNVEHEFVPERQALAPQLAVGHMVPDRHGHLRHKPNFHQVGNSESFQYFHLHDPRTTKQITRAPSPPPTKTYSYRVNPSKTPIIKYNSPYTTKRTLAYKHTKPPKKAYPAVLQRGPTIGTPRPRTTKHSFKYFTPRAAQGNISIHHFSTPRNKAAPKTSYAKTNRPQTTTFLTTASTQLVPKEHVKDLPRTAQPAFKEFTDQMMQPSTPAGQTHVEQVKPQLHTPEHFYASLAPFGPSRDSPLTFSAKTLVKQLPSRNPDKSNPFLQGGFNEVTTERESFSTPLYRSHVDGVIFAEHKTKKEKEQATKQSPEVRTLPQRPLHDDIQEEASQNGARPVKKIPRLSESIDFEIVKPVSKQAFLDFGTFKKTQAIGGKQKRKIGKDLGIPNNPDQNTIPHGDEIHFEGSESLSNSTFSKFQIIKQTVNVYPDDNWQPSLPKAKVVDPNEPPLCQHPAPVTNGQLRCHGPQPKENHYIPGSHCSLLCQPGYASVKKWQATCGKDGAWHSSAALRCEETVAVLIGGWNPENGTLRDVEVFDANSSSDCANLKLAPLPQARRGLIAGWIDGRIIACGGHNNTQEHNLCWQYEPWSDQWHDLDKTLGKERHFAAYATIDSKLIALGGRDGRAKPMAIGTVEELDPSWTWMERPQLKLSQERAYHCAVPLNDDTLVVSGGYSYNSVVGMTEAYNLTTDSQWRSLGNANLHQPRYLHSCAQVSTGPNSNDYTVIVAGGYANDYLNSTEVFDPILQSWTQVGDLEVPRQGAQMGFLNGMPTIMGGFYDMNKFPKILEQYDKDTKRWRTLIHELQIPRRYFALVQVPRSVLKCSVSANSISNSKNDI
eukprot:TCALIF_07386-PA protein Name:"Similar to Ivns1abp Influenza virus NS1A-binding protein homolog (Mus musculus)" AED:0.38 eAED:0.38 QI:0/0/0/0.33/1/1/3/0/1579